MMPSRFLLIMASSEESTIAAKSAPDRSPRRIFALAAETEGLVCVLCSLRVRDAFARTRLPERCLVIEFYKPKAAVLEVALAGYEGLVSRRPILRTSD